MGIQDFFLTLSSNNNWPYIQSTIRKGWGATADPFEINNLSVEPNDKMSVGPHPLKSMAWCREKI